MSLALEDLNINTELPDIPRSMPGFKVRSASLEERSQAIRLFGEILDIGELRPVEIHTSLCFLGEAGAVEFYIPSGSLWARNVASDQKFEDEVRPWKTERIPSRGMKEDFELVLSDSENEKLTEMTRAVLEKTGLYDEHAYFADVSLEQCFRQEEDDEEEQHLAGEAVARFLYRLEGIDVDGGGAKSYAYFNPDDGEPKLVGVYHAWREIVDTHTVQMIGPEEAMHVALTRDKELNLYHKRGHIIDLMDIDLVYYARPPFKFQGIVFPAYRVSGFVYDPEHKAELGFHFSRFFHAVPPEHFARAGLLANYLTMRL